MGRLGDGGEVKVPSRSERENTHDHVLFNELHAPRKHAYDGGLIFICSSDIA